MVLPFRPFPSQSSAYSRLIFATILALTAGIFILDLHTPLGVADGILYLLPIFLTIWIPQRKNFEVRLAVFCTALIVLGAFFSPSGEAFAIWGSNRAISIVGIWASTAFLVQRKRVEAELQESRGELEFRVEERTAALVDANKALREQISERCRAEESLRQSEQRFRLTIDHANDAILYLDLNGLIQWASRQTTVLTGRPMSELIGRPIRSILTADAGALAEARLAAVRRGEPVSPLVEFEILRAEGEKRWVEANITSVLDHGAVVGRLFVARDITDRMRADRERRMLHRKLEDSHEGLQTLSRRLLEAQEVERRRIARELHDETGQTLTSLMIGLRTLEEIPTLAEAHTRASDLRILAAHAIDEIKRLARGLHPSVLDDLGLEAALKRSAEELTLSHAIPVDVHINGLDGRRLPHSVEIVLYRIAQEALTNAATHASPRHICILLQCSPSIAKLIVEDDGRGFDVQRALQLASPGNRLGLIGMCERAALLSGSVDFESSPGKGATVYAQVPISKVAG